MIGTFRVPNILVLIAGTNINDEVVPVPAYLLKGCPRLNVLAGVLSLQRIGPLMRCRGHCIDKQPADKRKNNYGSFSHSTDRSYIFQYDVDHKSL